MIPPEISIQPGQVVRHIDGLLYQVAEVVDRTDDYEIAHRLGGASVTYIQLQAGTFPIGKRWNKPEAGFREYFTIVESSDGTEGVGT